MLSEPILLTDKEPKELVALFQPRADQMQGTKLEVLAEIAGRICYDSFGVGRSSKDWHKHVLDVGHLSVYEHCWFQCDFDWLPEGDEWEYIGVPGINIRDRFLEFNARFAIEHDDYFGAVALERLMPQLWSLLKGTEYPVTKIKDTDCTDPSFEINDNWSTVLLTCSRACSHELVRHGDNTAISQRSTRYVNEAENGLGYYQTGVKEIDEVLLKNQEACLINYKELVSRLSGNSSNSVKVINGLARYALPHNLLTQVVFSASKEQWEHMIKLRTSPAADQEIRNLFNSISKIVRK